MEIPHRKNQLGIIYTSSVGTVVCLTIQFLSVDFFRGRKKIDIRSLAKYNKRFEVLSNLCNSCSELESSCLCTSVERPPRITYKIRETKSSNSCKTKFSFNQNACSQNLSYTLCNNSTHEFTCKEKGLHIASLNIQHLFPKLDEIRIILNMENSSDIFRISEIFLTENIQNSNLNINGFVSERKDRLHKLGGGLLVYIADHINFKRRSDIKSQG